MDDNSGKEDKMPRNTLEKIYDVCDKIEPNEYGCCVYPGMPYHNGSCVVVINYKRYKVHRLILERKLGRSIKSGYFALHICDCPSCVNQNHLYEGTHQDNMRDRVERNLESWDYMKSEAQAARWLKRTTCT
jgi:hypothetical protein